MKMIPLLISILLSTPLQAIDHDLQGVVFFDSDHRTSSEFVPEKVALITGANKGIGKETTQAFALQGWVVYAGVRDLTQCDFAKFKHVICIRLDVTSESDIELAVAQIIKDHKHIDALINNAGIGVLGHEEEVYIKEAKKVFDVNYFGVLRLTQEVLPHMRQAKAGHIINISSTSGVRAIAGLGVYAASKFALEALSESLAQSLQHFGIKVVIVEPGTVKNDWFANVVHGSRAVETDGHYYKKLSIYRTNLGKSLANKGQEMFEIANKIVEIAQNPSPNLRYQTSQQVEDVVKSKFIDPSGNNLLKSQIQTLNDNVK